MYPTLKTLPIKAAAITAPLALVTVLVKANVCCIEDTGACHLLDACNSTTVPTAYCCCKPPCPPEGRSRWLGDRDFTLARIGFDA